jgi:prophage maintenance system killer protein
MDAQAGRGANLRHPFDAANKRTALAVGSLFLQRNGISLNPHPEEAKAHVLAIREGRATAAATPAWIQEWTETTNP